jgi:hypothetical protein
LDHCRMTGASGSNHSAHSGGVSWAV